MADELLYDDEDVEGRIRGYFAENYELIRLEGGNHLSPEVLENALQQVIHYWRKLKDVAQKVTETEVKLTLSDQTTPSGRKYGIEGVVDIVREDNTTTMYDLKTHEAGYVRANVDQYAPQLNVYAHIWQNLRGQPLDETAIISTVLPSQLREAINREDAKAINRLMAEWEPLISVPFDASSVADTIQKFGKVVDRIEDHEFAPPPVEKLKSRVPGQMKVFAGNICLNCDARFSCDSYRAYALKSGTEATRTFRQYFNDTSTDVEKDDWLSAGLAANADVDYQDFT